MTIEAQTQRAKTSLMPKPAEWLRAFERGLDYDQVEVLHHRISVLEAKLNALEANTLAHEQANPT